MNPLDRIDHRPWPLPAAPWVMAQSWHDLLFAHWPVPIESLRAAIPPALEIDTFAGQAWLGVVPFRMSGVRLRGTPPLPWVSAFPELNLRTYVTLDGRPGVWFFALEAANPLAVALARAWFHLPYFRARMKLTAVGEGVLYTSRRIHRQARPAELVARYGPTGPVYRSRHDTLEQWLTERYCLYAQGRGERLYRGDIHHAPWPLQPAQAELELCTLPRAHDLELPACAPLLHFARRVDMVAWSPVRVR
jgi:uncharacterized protein YqjF (DUF2071 family)